MLRIKLRYDDVEAMAQRFAANIGKSGLFVPTKSVQPVGAEVKFELRLANDTPVITGLGRVRAARAPDPTNPRAVFGMAIELLRVTKDSRDVILKLLERRRHIGLPDVAIPMPDDVEAARRFEAETSTGSAPKLPPARDMDTDAGSAPRDPVLRDGAPVAGEPALAFTAPRRTGPIAVAKVHTVAPLAPEPPRKRRAPVHELIESASGRVVAVMLPELDADVDVGAVLARARALAVGDLDAELASLRDSAAAPFEITVEAASAELARQLGGKPVARIHAVAEGTPAPMPVIEAAPEPVAEPVVDDEPTPLPGPAPEPEPEPVAVAVAEPDEPTQFALRDSAPALPIEPDQIADEIHRLDENDFEEVEQPTQAGVMPFPTLAPELEESLERQLADADEDLGLDDEEQLEEIDDFEILDEADEPPLAARPSNSDFASRLDLDDDDPIPLDTPTAPIDPRVISAANAIAAFDDAFDNSDVIALPERAPRAASNPDDIDLEQALEDLDVDLDDLAIPHAKTELPRQPISLPRKHPRAASEDGLTIDFDDDDD